MATLHQLLASRTEPKSKQSLVPEPLASSSQHQTLQPTDNHRQQDFRFPKLDFPFFSGDGPHEWIRKAQKYFALDQIQDQLRLGIAELHLRDQADIWFDGFSASFPRACWEFFSSEICKRFATISGEEIIETFCKITQTHSVKDYIERFESLKSLAQPTLPHMPESYFISIFSSRLHTEVKSMVKIARPVTLAHAFEIAQLQETALAAIQHPHKPWKQFASSKWPDKTPTPVPPSSLPESSPDSSQSSQCFQKISPADLQLKRQLGLCYKCNEKYSRGHVCAKGSVHFILTDPIDGTDINVEEIPGTIITDDAEIMEISLHALTGYTSNSTFRIAGSIHQSTISILIDSGSTHSFIDEQLARVLHLPLDFSRSLQVTVANGEKVLSAQIFSPTSCTMHSIPFNFPLRALKLGGNDMILGIDWINHVSPVTFNLPRGFLKITVDVGEVCLPTSTSTSLIKLVFDKCFSSWVQQLPYFIIAQIQLVATAEQPQHTPSRFQKLLQEFQDVFALPKGLPPKRELDHSLPLLESTKPFRLQPYRCPFIQKTEIERLVKVKLQEGIITTSNKALFSLDSIKKLTKSQAVFLQATLVLVVSWLVFCFFLKFTKLSDGRNIWFKIRWRISRLDIFFATRHGLDDQKVVVKRKTELGGVFSIASWILFICLFGVLVYQILSRRSIKVRNVRAVNSPELISFMNDMEFNITTISNVSTLGSRFFRRGCLLQPSSSQLGTTPEERDEEKKESTMNMGRADRAR